MNKRAFLQVVRVLAFGFFFAAGLWAATGGTASPEAATDPARTEATGEPSELEGLAGSKPLIWIDG